MRSTKMSTTHVETFQYISQNVGAKIPGPGSLKTLTTSVFHPLPAAYASAELKTSSRIAFRHVAVWDDANNWIEMRLRAIRAMTVRLPAIDLTIGFAQGEELRTEISTKFTPEGVRSELEATGLVIVREWTDAAGDFLVVLARPYC